MEARTPNFDFSSSSEARSSKPQRILVLNCGSSSLKYCFYDTEDSSRKAGGQVDRIGIEGTKIIHRGPLGKTERPLSERTFRAAFENMFAELSAPRGGVITGIKEISMVVHRVVHGGEKFSKATRINDEVVIEIEELSLLAPLHNPVNAAGIREMRKLCPSIPQFAVFDTAFHQTIPPHAFIYGLPYELYATDRVRRYGFHGTSHEYVALRAAHFLRKRPEDLRIISCHLGNGSSVCAIDRGRSVDTSMGLTPAEGLIMGTRTGDLDPGIFAFLERNNNYTISQCEELINNKSGLLGISGVSRDMREVLREAHDGNSRAQLALQAYCYRVRKYIGAYLAALGGADLIIFTAGIGEGSSEVRELILEGLGDLGIVLDPERNRNTCGEDAVCQISAESSNIVVLVIPTDEEKMMASQALQALEEDMNGERRASGASNPADDSEIKRSFNSVSGGT